MKKEYSFEQKYNQLKENIKKECYDAGVKYIIQLRALKDVYADILKEMEDDFREHGTKSKEK